MDLVGIEPTTSSMPWNSQNRILLTAKTLKVGRVGKNHKNRRVLTPNLTPNWAGADSGGSALFLCLLFSGGQVEGCKRPK